MMHKVCKTGRVLKRVDGWMQIKDY